MQINRIDRALESLSIFPNEPYRKRQESDCRRGNGIPLDSLFASSPSASQSSLFGDSIGMESSVEILKDDDFRRISGDGGAAKCVASLGGSTRDRRFSTERRAFPPPIPSLARTENLQSRMPWILRRHYTGDGRLILTEEKSRRHEYFQAHRCNGRLTLHLVPLEVHDHHHDEDEVVDDDNDDDDGDDDDDSEETENDDEKIDDHVMDGGDDEAMIRRLRYPEVHRRIGSRCVVNGVAVSAAIRPVHS